MDLYYVNINEFKKKFDKDFLNSYCEIKTSSDKRFFEHTAGRFSVRYIAENIYNVTDTEIITNEKGKPLFKNSDLHFGISHSKDFVLICYDSANCGIDIEFMKKRDLSKLSNYFKKQFNNYDEFFEFWTKKEAVYKLGETVNSCVSFKYENDYYISIASKNNIDMPVKIKDFFEIYREPKISR